MIFWKKPEPPKKTDSQYILGISAYGSDPAAAILKDDELLFEGSEAALTGKKASGCFPAAAVAEALAKASEAEGSIMGVKDLAAVAFHEKPLLKYGRFFETWMANAPGGAAYFIASSAEAFLAKRAGTGLLKKELAAVSWGEEARLALYPEYLLSGAASAFYLSTFEEAAILVLDGPGEWASAAIAIGSGERIKILREIRFPDSPDLLCSALAGYIGLKGAAVRNLFAAVPAAGTAPGKDYAALIKKELVELREDGSLRLSPLYFNPAAGMAPDYSRWTALFGLPKRAPDAETTPEHLAFAAAARQVLEETLFLLAAQAKRLTGTRNLCLGGGSALNLAVNGKLKASGLFSEIRVQPAAPSAGRAAGAALAARHIHFGARRGAVKTPAAVPESPSAGAEEAAPPGPLASFSLYLHFCLTIIPSALLRRLKGEPPALDFKKNTDESALYAARNHIYSPEDLKDPL